MKYDGKFVKLPGQSAMWAVDDGKRVLIETYDQMYSIGLRQIVFISSGELAEIPVASRPKEQDEEE